MGFAEQAESWRAKAHLTGVRLPVLVGVTALAAIVLIAAGGALVKAGTADGFSLSRDEGAATSDGADEEGAASGEARTVFVHVGGAVVEPGVRELAEGARVQDAVDAAGGFADGAARDALNLARVLADGEQIVVPSQEEAVSEPGAAVNSTRCRAWGRPRRRRSWPTARRTAPSARWRISSACPASGTRSSPIWPISYAWDEGRRAGQTGRASSAPGAAACAGLRAFAVGIVRGGAGRIRILGCRRMPRRRRGRHRRERRTLAIRSRSRRFAGPLWRNVLRAREPSRHRSRYGAA